MFIRKQSIPLDINEDGDVDFLIYTSDFSTGFIPDEGNAILANSVAWDNPCGGSYDVFGVERLPPNAVVNGGTVNASWKGFLETPALRFENCHEEEVHTTLPIGSRGWLGIRFLIDGELHYGWIAINRQEEFFNISYIAYNKEPGFGMRTFEY